jgi:hypothetical protein
MMTRAIPGRRSFSASYADIVAQDRCAGNYLTAEMTLGA